MKPDTPTETLAAFKDSFSYGSRGDLTFKFLKKLSPDEAGEAIRQILDAIGESFDTGSVDEVHELVIGWQVRAYTPDADGARSYVYDDAPFAPFAGPLAESRVGLLTSSGHFASDDDPEPLGVTDISQADAVARISEFLKETPVLSLIPRDIAAEELRVRHGGYDVRSTVRDYNVAFPRDALLAAEEAGRIGELADQLLSFPGATSQGRLRKKALPGWIDILKSSGIDALLLVPV